MIALTDPNSTLSLLTRARTIQFAGCRTEVATPERVQELCDLAVALANKIEMLLGMIELEQKNGDI